MKGKIFRFAVWLICVGIFYAVLVYCNPSDYKEYACACLTLLVAPYACTYLVQMGDYIDSKMKD